MHRHADNKNKESSAGLLSSITVMLMIGYAAGSPTIAPMLPPMMERAFVNLNQNMTDVALKAMIAASQTLEQVGVIRR
jgi:hypothetical protein